jgi:hypothetical protein
MKVLGLKPQKLPSPIAAASSAPSRSSAPTATQTAMPTEDTMMTENARKRKLQEAQQRGGVQSTVLGQNDSLGG